MTPKTKYQKLVAAMSRKLPDLSAAQSEWAKQHVMVYTGRRTAKGVITCTACTHEWQGNGPLVEALGGDSVCPKCGRRIVIKTSRKEKFKKDVYFEIVTTFKGHQVVRHFTLEMQAHVGHGGTVHSCYELEQLWLSPMGDVAKIALIAPFCLKTSWTGEFEIRKRTGEDVNPDKTYPRERVIPELTLRGYERPIGGLSAFASMTVLLQQPKAETLLKSGQTQLIYDSVLCDRKIADYWPSIRIALRNGWDFQSVGVRTDLWFDLIDLLKHFGKDIRSPRYVCPADVKVEHDRWVDKRRAEIRAEDAKRHREEALQAEAEYERKRKRFFDIVLTDKNIECRVIPSVAAVAEEGDTMHHCVFVNKYYTKPESLLFSARVGGHRVETVEFSLSQGKVVQSRGHNNSNSVYHDRIISLIERNKKLILKNA